MFIVYTTYCTSRTAWICIINEHLWRSSSVVFCILHFYVYVPRNSFLRVWQIPGSSLGRVIPRKIKLFSAYCFSFYFFVSHSSIYNFRLPCWCFQPLHKFVRVNFVFKKPSYTKYYIWKKKKKKHHMPINDLIIIVLLKYIEK